jgi:hypothetical protein
MTETPTPALGYAGTSGSVVPDLDELQPSEAETARQVTNGGGGGGP